MKAYEYNYKDEQYKAAVAQRMKDEKARQKALASQRLQVMYQEKSALLQVS